MIDRNSLLQEIVQQPHSDGPRLRYAKWLEENGQPDRAELIIVQCSLQSDTLTLERRKEFERRERELLHRYAWDWAEEFGEVISEWQYERGFIRRIQTGLERTAEEIMDVVGRGPVTHLRDTGQFCDLQGFVDALPRLNHLTGLEFWSLYAFEDQLIAEILQSPHLTSLKTLVLHHDRNGNLVDEQVIIDGLLSPNRANLEQLAVNVDCSWRGPTNAIIDAIATSPYLRNLRRLDLSNAGDPGNDPQLNVDTVRRLSESPNLANVEILDLRSVHATAAVWNAILEMPLLKQLKKLYLSDACEVPEGEWIPIVGQIDEIPHWREAFCGSVKEIDWGLRFIDPWTDVADYWSGHTWSERRRGVLFRIADFVTKCDFDGLEKYYHQLCETNAGQQVAQTVANVQFDIWAEALREPMLAAADIAEARHSLAVVVRIRPDIRWQSHVCVHDQYGRDFDDIPDDSFEPFEEYSHSGPDHELNAGECLAAAQFLAGSPLNAGTLPNYASIYLIARCVAAFGRVERELAIRQRVYLSLMWYAFRFR